jgi:hypothetical protein
MRSPSAKRSDEGSVLPLVALWLAVLVLSAMAIVAGVDAAVARARAQAAADAAALAGAAEGRVAARMVAERNGGVLLSFVEVQPGAGPAYGQPGAGPAYGPGIDVIDQAHLGLSGVVVTVVVEVDGASAAASAERFLLPVGFLSPP